MTEFIQKTTAKSSTISSQSPDTSVHEVSVSMSSPIVVLDPSPKYSGQNEFLMIFAVTAYILLKLFK